ncbi:macro domain-containing protein [Candidatus Dependentiae bacterium]|nr:macro domain-containing protein [Candidatus Dependentiae bacterium]
MYKKSIFTALIFPLLAYTFISKAGNQLRTQDRVLPNGKTISLAIGNLEDQLVEAVVNPANEYLSHGAGVARTLADFFPDLQDLSDKLPANKTSFYDSSQQVICPVGTACTTKIYTQPKNPRISHVIHAVGPRGNDIGRKQLLYNAYRSSLEQAELNGISTIAFPPISIGIFNYPLHEATEVALSAAIDYLSQTQSDIQKVVFVIWPGDKRFDEILSAYESQIRMI